MPELPEVEHARRSLSTWLEGRTIVRAEASRTRVFRGADLRAFSRALRGRTLDRLDRRGKYLLFTFAGGAAMVSHLGMTGKWVRRPSGEATDHSRARIHLDDATVLHYSDPRMFGRIAVYEGKDPGDLPEIRALGPDPLLEGIDVGRLHADLARSARAVKVAIMDQRVLAGIGNIHATEALFRAGVLPTRPGKDLSLAEVAAIAEAIRASIDHAFLVNGPGEITYLGEAAAENRFLIYDRAGGACPRCGATLEQVQLGGRTSAYCPRCQR